MTRHAFIQGLTYYLPERVLTNEDLNNEFPDWSVDKITAKIGVRSRHLAGATEYVSDMAVAASKKLFTEYSITPSTIDFILLCTQSPDYFLPTTACLVQDRLGIPTHAGALDFNQGCSGFVYGLAMAKGLVLSGIARNVLLITAETYSRHIHHSDRGNRSIFGDAAAATLISDSGFARIEDFELGTNGAGASQLIVKNGGMRQPRSFDAQPFNPDDYLFMDGTGIFNFTLGQVPLLTNRILEKHGLGLHEVNWFVFHQANRFMLDHLRKKIGIPEEKFLMYMESCGNTVSSTIPIVLKEAHGDGRFRGGDCVLLASFGVGLSWAGTVLKITG